MIEHELHKYKVPNTIQFPSSHLSQLGNARVKIIQFKSDFLRKPADLVLGFYEIGS